MVNWLNVNLFFLAAWCCLQMRAVIMEHHPVLEGSKTTLVCEGNSSRSRSVYWKKIFPNNTVKPIATCHNSNQQKCEVKNREYVVQQTSDSTRFVSSLSRSVTIEDRNITINCSMFDYSDNSTQFIRSWIFSMNYHPAGNAVCRAVQANVDNISVNCSVESIYPGFICEMSEIYENKTSTVNQTEIKYRPGRIDSRGYISASCYVVRQVTHKGIYKYRVKIYPDKMLSDLETAVRELETEQIEILLVPTGVLEQEQCSGDNAALVFKCTAYLFSSMPGFQWSLDEGKFTKTKSSVISSNGHDQFVSHAELPGNTSQNGRRIQCRIETGSQILFNETKTILHIWPTPQRPYFIDDRKSILGRILTLQEPKQSNMFTCQPNGNTENMTQINVTCKTDSQTLLDIFGHNTSLYFNINYSAADSSLLCQCSVQYTTECILSNQLNIITYKLTSHLQPLGTTKTMMIIIAGLVLLILLVCMIATILFMRNRWSQLYLYIYDRSSTSNGLNTGFVNNGLYSDGSGTANNKLSAASHSYSPSGWDNEGEEAMPLEMLPNVGNITQRLSECNDSGCGDNECLPPAIPPRGHLASDSIIPATHSSLTSQRKTPECCSLNSTPESSISNPRHESWFPGHEPEPCSLTFTDDGYLKPMELLHDSHHFKRDTSRRNNEKNLPQPCHSEDVSTAGYLHIVPDLPPREPLSAGALRKSSRSLRPTDEFLPSSPPLPPRQPMVLTTSGTAPCLNYSNVSRRMN